MTIDRIPSAWDYLGEGISGYNQGAAQAKEQRLKEFNIINQLYQSGGATAEQLNEAGRATGIPSLASLSALPSSGERKQQVLRDSMQPVGNVAQPTYTPPANNRMGNVTGMPMPAVPNLTVQRPDADLAAEVAGVSGPTARESARVRLGTEKTQQQIATTSAAAQPQDIKLRQNKEADDLFRDAGSRFVSKYIDPATVNASQRRVAVEGAFNEYKQTRANSSMGQIPDEPYAKSFFDEAFTNALREKAKMDLETKVRLGASLTAAEKMYAQLETTRSHLKDAQDDIAARDKMLLTFKLGDPQYANDPNVVNYNRLADQIKRVEAAQAMTLDPKLRAAITAPPVVAPKQQGAPPPLPPKVVGIDAKVQQIIATLKPVTDIVSFNKALADIKDAQGKYITKDEAKAAEKKVRALWDQIQHASR